MLEGLKKTATAQCHNSERVISDKVQQIEQNMKRKWLDLQGAVISGNEVTIV